MSSEEKAARINAAHAQLYLAAFEQWARDARDRASAGLPPLPFPAPIAVVALQNVNGQEQLVETGSYITCVHFLQGGNSIIWGIPTHGQPSTE